MIKKGILCLAGLMLVFTTAMVLAQTENTVADGFSVSGHFTIKETGIVYLELLTEEQFAIEDDDAEVNTAELKIVVSEQDIKHGKVPFTFKNIPAGTYAIEAYLDKNENADYDGGLFGGEPWGFYRPARPKLGDPKFDEVKFDVLQDLADLDFEIK